MERVAELLARFDVLALPWQLAIMAGLALGVVMVLLAGQAQTRRSEASWDS